MGLEVLWRNVWLEVRHHWLSWWSDSELLAQLRGLKGTGVLEVGDVQLELGQVLDEASVEVRALLDGILEHRLCHQGRVDLDEELLSGWVDLYGLLQL